MSRINIAEFNKLKNSVLKKHPTAILKLYNDNYYIADESGKNLISEELQVSALKTPYAAWKQTALALQLEPIINRNAYKFSDDKFYESYTKKLKDKTGESDEDIDIEQLEPTKNHLEE